MLARFPSIALVRRELVTSLRRPRAIVFLALVVLGCMAGVWGAWPSPDEIQTRATSVSTNMLDMVSLALLAACGLLLPGIAATSLAVERDRQTFDLLHLSLIPPRGVVFGKAVNALGFYALIAIGVLPVLGVVFFLVGVSWAEVGLRFVLIGWTATATIAMGIYCSARFRRTNAALAASYIAVLGIFSLTLAMPFLVYEILSYIRRHHHAPEFVYGMLHGDLIEKLVAITPVMIFDTGRGAAYRLCYMAFLMLLSSFFFWRAMRLLGRPPKMREIQQAKPIDDVALLEERRKRFPYYLIDPLKRKKHVEDGRNPILVKELRWGLLGRMTLMVRFFYIALMIDMAIGIWCGHSYSRYNWVGRYSLQGTVVTMMIFMACVCLPTPILLANLFTKEREQGNLDMLRMTLVRPREIVLGKLAAGAMNLAPLIVAAGIVSCLIAGVFATLEGQLSDVWIVGTGLVTLCVCAWVVLTATLRMSLAARSSASAVVLSYILTLTLHTAPFVAALTLLKFLWQPQACYYSYSTQKMLFSNPVLTAATFSPVMAFRQLATTRSPNPVPYWLLSCLMFTLVGAFLLRSCLRAFRKRHMRDVS